MKNILRTFLLIILTLSITLCLFSCKTKEECKNHFDTNGDGLCEECGEKAEKKQQSEDTNLSLLGDETINFRVVRSASASIGMRQSVDSLVATLKKLGYTLEVVEDSEATVKNDEVVEILIGDVTSRGDKYLYDSHNLGLEGYVVKIIDDKIVINGGQDASFDKAFVYFVEDILGIDDDTDELSDVTMKEDDNVEVIQNNYEITSVSIGGQDIKGYTIAVDSGDKYFAPIATEIQTQLYKLAGYWLPTVPLNEASEKSIVLALREKDSTPEDSFRIYVKGTALYIESEYVNCVKEEAALFIAKYITNQEGDINITGSITKKDYSTVKYEDFGAKGDGKTNDFDAIREAHAYANEGGQIVLGKPTATYYISTTNGKSIVIKTPTDWQGAKFIIDDTDLHETTAPTEIKTPIIKIESYNKSSKATYAQLEAINAGEKLGPNTTKLDLNLGYRAMLNITNSNHRVYIRYGGNQNDGSNQHELVVVDEKGNIEEGTELLLTYDKVSSIVVYRIDDEPMEVKNGSFTTLASRVSTTQVVNGQKVIYRAYFERGMVVSRANTTITNVSHVAQNEFTVEEQDSGLTGPSYHGFFSAENASDITFKDCQMSGRRYYKIQGTYGISAGLSNMVIYDHCIQTNYYLPNGNRSTTGSVYWGIGGSNYCKNIIYKDSMLTRFDAHAGLYRGKILNSQVAMVNLIGGGDFLIEDSVIEDNEFITLRTDYGATWDGTITIKNSTLDNNNAYGRICTMLWTNHDFGYTCHFPNFILDNIKHKTNTFELESTGDSSTDPNQDSIASWGDYLHIKDQPRKEYAVEPKPRDNPDAPDVINKVNVNPLDPPDFIIAKNCKNVVFRIADVDFFDSTMIRGFKGYPDYNPNEALPTK